MLLKFPGFPGMRSSQLCAVFCRKMFKPAGIYLKRRYETADCILRALLTRSDLLLMDEPFTGLDEGTKDEVIKFLKEYRQDRFLLISTHQKEDVEKLGGILLTL